MISDEKRRLAAAKLRALADANEGRLGTPRMALVLREGQEILGTVGLASVADVLRRHAELIDRPTCHVVKFERGGFISDGVAHRFFELRCSNCGEEPWSDVESVTRFCPCCGAEVVA